MPIYPSQLLRPETSTQLNHSSHELLRAGDPATFNTQCCLTMVNAALWRGAAGYAVMAVLSGEERGDIMVFSQDLWWTFILGEDRYYDGEIV